MTETLTDYDSAWKEVLERYFEQFLHFFFPRAIAEQVGNSNDLSLLNRLLKKAATVGSLADFEALLQPN